MKNRYIMLHLFALGCLLCPVARAVVPPPDGGYPGNNTAEGQNALLSLTTGTFNTAVGSLSLKERYNRQRQYGCRRGNAFCQRCRPKHGHRGSGALKQYDRDAKHGRRCTDAFEQQDRIE